MSVRPIKVRLEPSGKVLEVLISPDATISDLANLLRQEYGISSPVIMAKRADKQGPLVVVPFDIRIEDLLKFENIELYCTDEICV